MTAWLNCSKAANRNVYDSNNFELIALKEILIGTMNFSAKTSILRLNMGYRKPVNKGEG
jgi:hypothetical protein